MVAESREDDDKGWRGVFGLWGVACANRCSESGVKVGNWE
jgi:hypothetical protein